MAVEEQLELNLGGIPDNTIGQDPVSGNDIPLGSTAENVRDDIPANLSEGEIVVPADVVNFHGVKLFEDLRAEAKVGYAQMAEDGRIGGSPLPTTTPNMADIDIELTLEDLEASEDMGEEQENTVEMNRGGMNFERGRGNMYSSYSAPKAPFAVMTGKYVEASDDEAFKLAKDVFDNDDVTQVGYDPTRRGFFYDRETGEAVVQADTVIQVGHLVLARNAKKMDAEAFPFNEGGMAMEKQMEMNFSLGGIPDNTIGQDPVSGNDIPVSYTHLTLPTILLV